MGEIKLTDPEVLEVERRLLGQITETNADLASLKGDMKSVREAQSVVLSRIQEQGETLAKMADKGRITFAGVIAAILAGIGIMQYIDQPSDEEREQNRRRIEKLEDAASTIASNRHTRDDQKAFEDKVAEALAEVEARAERRLQVSGEALLARLEAVKEDTDALAQNYQTHDRDVSSLNAKQNGQIAANEERSKATEEALRLHMANGHPHSVIDQVKALERRVDGIAGELSERGGWMRETDMERASADAAYDARLTQLEREVAAIGAEQRRRNPSPHNEGL